MTKEEIGEFTENPSDTVRKSIENLVANSPENRLRKIDDSPIFDTPLVGFANGDDPLFIRYKEIIGSFHLTPREIMESSPATVEKQVSTDLSDITVICWALPIVKRTRSSNVSKDVWPSLRWAHTRHYGAKFNDRVRQHVISLFTEYGYLAVAPQFSPKWRWLFDQPGGPLSNWSERHALYVAGMGTFGLSDGFITPRGKAMLCGSVLVNLGLPSTPRPYGSHTDNCPFYTDRSCGVCIDRCPAGAINIEGHDRSKCASYQRDQIGHITERYEVEIAGCGLCQTGVPCESRIPANAPGIKRATV